MTPAVPTSLGTPLPRTFYEDDVERVAQRLLGKIVVRLLHGECLAGRIVETEAYSQDDPASHSYRGPTGRNRAMFGPAGHLYVYRIYAVHVCANVVTGPTGVGDAVLIRALDPLRGLTTMRRRRGVESDRLLCSGPARLCQALGITQAEDGHDLCSDDLYLADDGWSQARIDVTPRIGISKAANVLRRYVVAGSPYRSRR